MYIIATFLGLLNWIPVNPWSEMKTNIHYVTIDYVDISYFQYREPVQVSCAGEISDGGTQLELTFSTGGSAATEANTFICGDTM